MNDSLAKVRSLLDVRSLAVLGALAMPTVTACNGPGFEDPVDPGPSDTTPTPTDVEDPTPPDPSMDPELTDPEVTDPETSGPVDADGDGYIDIVDPSGELSAEWQRELDGRVIDYSAALRVASLRLRGTLPTLVEIRYVAGAPEPRVAYEQLIDQMLDEPAFHQRMIDFFRDTFRMGGGELDSAPVFAAQLVAEGRDFTEVFTATEGTCPTYDRDTDTFTAADCDNGVPQHAGLLTHPGIMRHYASNLAFRRVRFVQEVFACTPFPAEVGGNVDVGGEAPYTAPWPFESISGEDNGGRVDFHDTSSVICANCHATMNHIAPLFGRFAEDGTWQDDFAVMLPLDGSPTAVRTDWLPDDEGTGWRFGVPARNLSELGVALAADPEVERCAVTRVWNWAMGHGDVIASVEVVPDAVTDSIVTTYATSGHDLREVVRAVFTSGDFVSF
jgi:hypothetical protein